MQNLQGPFFLVSVTHRLRCTLRSEAARAYSVAKFMAVVRRLSRFGSGFVLFFSPTNKDVPDPGVPHLHFAVFAK